MLERLGEGELLQDICETPGMPSKGAIWRWRFAHPEFETAFGRARKEQAQAVAEKGVQTALRATPETAAAARVQFDASRWLAGRLDVQQWGDKQQVNLTGTVSLQALVEQATTAAIEPPTIDGTATESDTDKP